MPTQQGSRRCHGALQKEQTVRVISLKRCFLCTKFIHAHWFKATSALDLISGSDACLDLWQLSCRFSEKSDWSLVSVPICRPGCTDQTHLSRLRWHVFAQSVWRANEVEGTGCSSVAERLNFCLIWTKLFISLFCFFLNPLFFCYLNDGRPVCKPELVQAVISVLLIPTDSDVNVTRFPKTNRWYFRLISSVCEL